MRRVDWIWNLSTALIFIGGAGLALQLGRPLPPWDPPELPPPTPSAAPRAADGSPWSAAQIAVLGKRPLQQSLFDAPPTAAPPTPPPPRPTIELVGTAIGANAPVAIIRRPGTGVALVTLDDDLGSYRITAIERGRIRLANDADAFDVAVPWYAELAEARP